MREYVAFFATLLMLGGAIRYCFATAAGQIKPVFASWIIFGVASTLTLVSYFSGENYSLVSNAANVMDFFLIWGIVVTLVIYREKIDWRFTLFQVSCLSVAGVLLVFWIVSQEHTTMNLLVNGLMVVAYFPTLARLWTAKRTTELLSVWFVFWLASGLLTYPAYTGDSEDMLAPVYATRAVVFCTFLIALIIRIKVRAKKSKRRSYL